MMPENTRNGKLLQIEKKIDGMVSKRQTICRMGVLSVTAPQARIQRV